MTTAANLLLAMIAAFLLSSAAIAATYEAGPDTLVGILDKVEPGDTVLLADGVYKGGFLLTRSGADGAPITIKASGTGAVIDGGPDGLRTEGVSWLVIEGIRFQKAERAGLYLRAGKLPSASHITVRNCVFADNGSWGCITSHLDYFTIENCEAYGSVKEHGIYHANSGDDAVIRNNRVHHNVGHGIHVNGDPGCGGDGVISRALIEGNRIWENGSIGGGCINFMHVQDCVVRNNLIFNNHNNGIWFWRNFGDDDSVSSKRNRILNNTIYFRPGEGRFAVLIHRTVSDTILRNNVLVGGARGTVYVEPWALSGVDSDYNVIAAHPGQRLFGDATNGAGAGNRATPEEAPAQIEEFSRLGIEIGVSQGIEIPADAWLKRGLDAHSAVGLMPVFADPAAGDFRLREGSPGIDAGADLGTLVPTDIDGSPRPKGKAFDCGCYENM